MPTFISLCNFTDQGIRSVKDSVKRADAIRDAAKKFGVTLKDIHWTMGAYDVIVTFDAPDGASMSAFSLSVGMAGNIRAQTLRAFGKEEMGAILGKMS
jgi:uncharacterized protein with GYD domain